MARQNINNTPANSGQGDTLKDAFDKVNHNEAELYTKTNELESDKAEKDNVLTKGNPNALKKGDDTELLISDLATAQQGNKADTAVQPEALEDYSKVYEYVDVTSNRNILESDIGNLLIIKGNVVLTLDKSIENINFNFKVKSGSVKFLKGDMTMKDTFGFSQDELNGNVNDFGTAYLSNNNEVTFEGILS